MEIIINFVIVYTNDHIFFVNLKEMQLLNHQLWDAVPLVVIHVLVTLVVCRTWPYKKSGKVGGTFPLSKTKIRHVNIGKITKEERREILKVDEHRLHVLTYAGPI